MREAFRQYHRLLKKSTVKDKTFYPLMLRMTSDPTEDAWTEAMGEALERSTNGKQKAPIDRGTFHPVIMKMNASRGQRREWSPWILSLPVLPKKKVSPSGTEPSIHSHLHSSPYQPCGTTTSTTPTRTGKPPSSGLSNEDAHRGHDLLQQLHMFQMG